MVLTINLTPEQEALLSTRAANDGMPLEEYAVHKLMEASTRPEQLRDLTESTTSSAQSKETDSAVERFEQWVRSISDSTAPPIPLEALSREQMYAGRGEVCTDPACEICNKL